MIYAIIPARYQSTRFPGKPLAMIAGKSMVQRVYEQAKMALLVDDVLVATDDNRIFEHVESFGGKVVLTSDQHQSGTDRLAEVVLNHEEISMAINIQGDEPVIPPDAIDQVIRPFEKANIEMTTLIRKCESPDDLNNPNIVKAVIDNDGYAMYFSRSCIPYVRNEGLINHFLHIGIYGYRRETLLKLSRLTPAAIEKTESLEQLRALFNGINIKTVITDYKPVSVDVNDDILKVEEFLIAQQKK